MEAAETLARVLSKMHKLRCLCVEWGWNEHSNTHGDALAAVVWTLPNVRYLEISAYDSDIARLCAFPTIEAPKLEAISILDCCDPQRALDICKAQAQIISISVHAVLHVDDDDESIQRRQDTDATLVKLLQSGAWPKLKCLEWVHENDKGGYDVEGVDLYAAIFQRQLSAKSVCATSYADYPSRFY